MNFKKVLALVLVVAMCLSMIPTYAFADFDELVEEVPVEEAAPAEEFDELLEDDAPAEEPEEAPEAEEPAAEPEEVPAEEAAAPTAEGLSSEYTADYAAKNVAQVLTSDGWYQFATLAEAIAKVGTTEVDGEGTEIEYYTDVTLLNSATVNGLVIDKDITIHGDNKALNGTLIINDGSVAFDGMNFVGDMTVNGGDLIIDDGTFGNVVAGSDKSSL